MDTVVSTVVDGAVDGIDEALCALRRAWERTAGQDVNDHTSARFAIAEAAAFLKDVRIELDAMPTEVPDEEWTSLDTHLYFTRR